MSFWNSSFLVKKYFTGFPTALDITAACVACGVCKRRPNPPPKYVGIIFTFSAFNPKRFATSILVTPITCVDIFIVAFSPFTEATTPFGSICACAPIGVLNSKVFMSLSLAIALPFFWIIVEFPFPTVIILTILSVLISSTPFQVTLMASFAFSASIIEFATTPTKSSSIIIFTTPGILSAALISALTKVAPILFGLTTAPYNISGISASIPKMGSP